MHARSTASKSVKNNLRITEIMADTSLILSAQKSQKIINDHIEHRRQERFENPERFNVKPTLGDLCLRRPPPQPKQPSFAAEPTMDDIELEQGEVKPIEPEELPTFSREPSVQFKEISVSQMDKSALYNMPIQGF
ncbi:hypothetical protein KUTeg_023977 [Tegillarca granosa]|uniref:Uncharacterized protein n=1 Tax=Tegillarca granosa TaxID=220873 RepID=A0ABQ9E168_TEGGR|nr:hypothetical protein KUTeg_023977 [Tegillarca granosa]